MVERTTPTTLFRKQIENEIINFLKNADGTITPTELIYLFYSFETPEGVNDSYKQIVRFAVWNLVDLNIIGIDEHFHLYLI